jgi:predicted component of type VI protein secretion system
MKNLKHIVLLFFSLVVLASCGSSKPATTENKTQTITVKETVHDTIFKIEKDSSSYRALLECQNGKVVIKEVSQAEPGRNLKSPRVRLDSNQLKVDCEARAQELLAHYKDTHEATSQIITRTITIEVNKLTFWQQLQIWGFRIYTGLILLFAIWVYVKSKI